MQSDSTLSVVIVGGGFCGIMTLVNLVRKSDRKIKATLVNKGFPVARGIAYKTYSDNHLLNVEARNMSAFPDEPDHFVKWCKQQKDIGIPANDLPYAYLPRNVYGRYLEDIYNKTLRRRNENSIIEILEDEVVDIDRNSGGLLVHTWSGKTINAHKVVLATGNSEPGLPSGKDKNFLNHRNYFSNPWCESAVSGLGNDDNVLIIGTGLTMVDVVIGLREKNFKGKITALSPHGFTILAHKQKAPQRYILDELSPPYKLDSLFRLFYKHIRLARKRGMSGETVVDAIRAKTQEIWQQLSLVEKKKFMTHLRHLWGVARHRLPVDVHSQMQDLIKEGTLDVIAGRIKNISSVANNFEVTIQKRKDQSRQVFTFSRIINCTGPQSDIRKQNSPLFESLINKGIVIPDEMSLGVDATPEGKIIDSKKNISHNFFAIGNLLKGKLWESTAVPELRIQAGKIAEMILSENGKKQIVGNIDKNKDINQPLQ